MSKNRYRGRQTGFLSIEALMVVIVALAGMTLGFQWLSADSDRKINQAAADHAATFSDATSKWMKDNYSAIDAAATPLAQYTATAVASYLPPAFNVVSPYGQSYSIRVYKAAPGQLQVMAVTTGGETVGEQNIRKIAQLIGAKGGFVSSADTTKAQGAYGGWSMPFSNFGATPGAGKLAVALFFQDGALVSDYLYRNSVPGHPELNRMNTAIDMAGNDVSNGGTVSAKRGAFSRDGAGPCCGDTGSISLAEATNTTGKTASISLHNGGVAEGNVELADSRDGLGRRVRFYDNQGQGMGVQATGDIRGNREIYADGWFRTNGDGGWYSQKWNGGWYMSDSSWIRSYADKNIYTGGQMQAGTVRANNRLSTGEYVQIDGVATEGAACTPNGLVGRDANGLLLSCQSGWWTSAKTFSSTRYSSDGLTGTQAIYMDLGTHRHCGLSSVVKSQTGRNACYVYGNSSGWVLLADAVTVQWDDPMACSATCFD